MSNNKNITLLALLTFCLFVSVFSFYALQSIKNQHGKNIQNSLQTVLLSLEQTHQFIVNQRKNALKSLVTNIEFINKTKKLLQEKQNINISNNINSKLISSDITRILTPVLKQFNNTGFYIISPNNINLASNIKSTVDNKNIIKQYYPTKIAKVFSGKTLVIPVMPSSTRFSSNNTNINNTLTMFFVTPIYSDGKIIAALALSIDPIKHYSSIAKLGRIGESGETYFFNDNALLLSHSRFEHQLRQLNLIRNGQNSASHIKVVDPGGNLLTGYKPTRSLENLPLTFMAQQAIKKNSDYNLSGYRDYRGVNVVGAWTWNNEFEFGLTTEIDFDEAYKAYYHTRYMFLLVIIFSCITGIFIVLKSKSYKKELQTYNTKIESKVNERAHEFEQAKEKLHQANQELSVLAHTDSLTGLSNRRFFDDEFNKELIKAKQGNYSLGLIMLDIDYFKQYNDYYGHLMGDECLIVVASLLKSITPEKSNNDIIARFGGEEFIILINNAEPEYIEKLAHRIHSDIEQLKIHHKTTPMENKSITISVGHTIANGNSITSEKAFIKQADRALYRAKSSGRNQVINYKTLHIADEDNYTSIIVPFEKQK